MQGLIIRHNPGSSFATMSVPHNVIVDFGIFSGAVKAGLPSDTLPVPTINIPFPSMSSLVGNDGEDGQSSHVLAVFQDIYQRLDLAPNSSALTVILSICTPLHTRQFLVKILFDQLQVPSLYLADAPLMAAFGAAQSTCLSVLVSGNQEEVRVEICPVLDFVPNIQTAECIELDASSDKEAQLAHAIWAIVSRCDAEKRRALLENIIVAGDRINAVDRDTLSKHLRPFLAASPFAADHQPVDVKFKSLPEYYSGMLSSATKNTSTQDNPDSQLPALEQIEKNLAWFGAMIASKAAFSDNKAHYKREEWLRDGPRILTQS